MTSGFVGLPKMFWAMCYRAVCYRAINCCAIYCCAVYCSTVAGLVGLAPLAQAQALEDVADTVGRSLVAVGTLRPGARSGSSPVAGRFLGTGFAVGDGKRVVTSLHVVDQSLPASERLAVFSGKGQRMELRSAHLEQSDELHDLAVLRVAGDSLPVLELGGDDWLAVGWDVAFGGFPLGVNTGMYPVTHRGIISAITPLATPVTRSEALSAAQLRALREGFMVYQLDATVLAGHSGSPVYDVASGRVVAVILGHLTQAPEDDPRAQRGSGISYAVPVTYLRELLQ